MKKSHEFDSIVPKICLRHTFETAAIAINALSGYSRVLAIFNKLFVAA